jgi:hypothetical protein
VVENIRKIFYHLSKRELGKPDLIDSHMATPSNLRICPKGHKYYKSTDCPTCPVCEADRKPEEGFLELLSAPARRAMENNGILSVMHLSKWTQKEVLKLHGVGPASLPVFKKVLAENGLQFASE